MQISFWQVQKMQLHDFFGLAETQKSGHPLERTPKLKKTIGSETLKNELKIYFGILPLSDKMQIRDLTCVLSLSRSEIWTPRLHGERRS